MCHWICVQDYINHLKEYTKHFDKSEKGSKGETMYVNQFSQKEDFVKKYKEQEQDRDRDQNKKYYFYMVSKMLEQSNMCGHSESVLQAYISPKLFILLKEGDIFFKVLSE